MTIHKEGFKIIGITILILAVVNLFIGFASSWQVAILTWSIAASILIVLFVLNFFRSPNREGYQNANAVIAPADGKIVVIEEVEENEYLKGKAMMVSIFMNVFNVHINWFPVSGIIKYSRHHEGRFMSAWLPKASTENERTTIVLENENGKVLLVRQIAGAVARRIVRYAPEGANAVQGSQLGFIKFGSRVDVYLPLGTRIDVKLGQKVKGKQTILGWLE